MRHSSSKAAFSAQRRASNERRSSLAPPRPPASSLRTPPGSAKNKPPDAHHLFPSTVSRPQHRRARNTSALRKAISPQSSTSVRCHPGHHGAVDGSAMGSPLSVHGFTSSASHPSLCRSSIHPRCTQHHIPARLSPPPLHVSLIFLAFFPFDSLISFLCFSLSFSFPKILLPRVFYTFCSVSHVWLPPLQCVRKP